MSASRADPNGRKATVWRIDRFELVSFNARHKRWQYFAQDPVIPFDEAANYRDGESPHRRHIRRLLFMVRRAIERLVSGDHRGLFVVREATGKAADDIPIISPSFDGWKTLARPYLKYLAASAEDAERLPKPERERLGICFKKLSKPGAEASLRRSDAVTLLSLLPILETWDTWGCFVRPRQPTQEEAATRREYTKFVGLGDRSEPFHLLELEYPRTSSASRATNVIGEDVYLTLAWWDLANPASQLRFPDEKTDFFAYCREPDREDGEWSLYRSYGHFVDQLIRGLAANDSGRRIFIIAYPLRANGRLHFLQFALTTSDPNVTIRELWRDWSELHERFWNSDTKRILEVEQERIAIAAFQYAAASELRDLARSGRALDDLDLETVLAKNLYVLLPVEEVTLAKRRRWKYEPYQYDESTLSGIPGYVVGQRWRDRDVDEKEKHQGREGEFRAARYAIEGLISEADRDVVSAAMLPERAALYIEQQMEYLADMGNAIEEERRRERERRSAATTVLQAYFLTLSDSELQILRESDTFWRVRRILSRPFPEGVAADAGNLGTPLQALGQAYPGESETLWMGRIHHLLRPSLLMWISEYFESGPARMVSHRGSCDDDPQRNKFFTGGAQQLKEALKGHYTPLAKQISEVVVRDEALSGACVEGVNDARKFVRSFHAGVMRAARNKRYVPGSLEDVKSLTVHHLKCRINSFKCCNLQFTQSDGSGMRSFLLDPLQVLQPFFDAVRIRSADYFPTGIYTRRLRWERPGPNKWVEPAADYPAVRLVEHFFCVASRHDIVPEVFRESEVCEHWRSAQAAVGTLLLSSAERTLTFLHDKFIQAPVFHTKLRDDGTADRLEGMGARAGLIVVLQAWRTVDSQEKRRRWEMDQPREFSLAEVGE